MPNYVALGTTDSGSAGFDDYGGELEIHRLNFADRSTKSVAAGAVKTQGKFASIAWSSMGKFAAEYPAGVVAGGMTDGSISLWDPAKLMASHPQAQLCTMKHHAGAIAGLHFNPNDNSQHLLASGGSDAKVLIHALDRPDTPKNPFVPAPEPNTAKHTAEVSKVKWNTKVPHILASASMNGSCHVWDLRQKKSWCELRDAKRGAISDIVWNPTEGLQLITAMGDDTNPVINMWDLRSSTTVPLAQLQGHQQGILSMSWCPTDTSLLLSCGKDNHTFLWDLYERRPVYEFVNETTAAPAGGFGGFGMSAGRRYEATWSPLQKAVLSTCSFDRKVQVYSISGTKTQSARAPKWMRRPCSAGFGFGGKVVRFSGGSADEQAKQQPPGAPQPPRLVGVSTVVEDAELVAASRVFEASLAQKDYKGLCETKAEAAAALGDAHGESVWRFVQLVFEDSARSKLLQKLGFDAEAITAEVMKATSVGAAAAAAEAPPPPPDAATSEASAEDFFSGGGNSSEGESLDALGAAAAAAEASPPSPSAAATAASSPLSSLSDPPPGMTMKLMPVPSDESLDAVKRALLIGNFDAAVEGCFARGHLADALMLAASGGAELWEKTRARYFALEAKSRPYLNIVSAIINSKLGDLVAQSNLKDWKETLAILSTYGKSEEFSGLCEQLGARLEAEALNAKSASLCYLCAINVPKTVGIWIDELRAQGRTLGRVDSMSLHALIEKVSVFTQEDRAQLVDDKDPSGANENAMCDLFTQYGALLANQGEMVTASKYISSQDNVSNELRHRLFYASQMDRSGAAHPPLPFEVKYVRYAHPTLPSFLRDPKLVVSDNCPVFSSGGSVRQVGNSPNSGAGGGAAAASHKGAAAGDHAAAAAAAQPSAGAAAAAAAAASAAAQPAAAAAASAVVDPNAGAANGGMDPNTGLPIGWIWHQDPGSGRVYYQNTMTGATQWEQPVPEPQPVQQPQPTMTSPQPTTYASPATMASAHEQPQPQQQQLQPQQPQPASMYAAPTQPQQPQQYQQPQQPQQPAMQQQQQQQPQSAGPGGPATAPGEPKLPKLDGFKSGPGKLSEYAQQAAAGGAAASGGAGPADTTAIPENVKPIVPALNDLQARLAQVCTNGAEKKQLADVDRAVLALLKKLGASAVDAAIAEKALALVLALANGDPNSASNIQKDLAKDHWDEHKDWIKGMKNLVALCSKKFR